MNLRIAKNEYSGCLEMQEEKKEVVACWVKKRK